MREWDSCSHKQRRGLRLVARFPSWILFPALMLTLSESSQGHVLTACTAYIRACSRQRSPGIREACSRAARLPHARLAKAVPAITSAEGLFDCKIQPRRCGCHSSSLVSPLRPACRTDIRIDYRRNESWSWFSTASRRPRTATFGVPARTSCPK